MQRILDSVIGHHGALAQPRVTEHDLVRENVLIIVMAIMNKLKVVVVNCVQVIRVLFFVVFNDVGIFKFSVSE